MNRYKFNNLSRNRTKDFYLKPGYHWMINSLGILENMNRSVHYPVSIEIVSMSGDRVSFIDSRGGGEIQRGKLLYMYDAMDHR